MFVYLPIVNDVPIPWHGSGIENSDEMGELICMKMCMYVWVCKYGIYLFGIWYRY
jgi:hypothetical protein